MQHLWTWGGIYFGYRTGDDLWTCTGFHVGRFRKDEVYDRNGIYLGEVQNDSRLIIHQAKGSRHIRSFTPCPRRIPLIRMINYTGFHVYAGFTDFPSPDFIAASS